MRCAVCIPTCIYPTGLKRLLDSIWKYPAPTSDVIVRMDGNKEYKRCVKVIEVDPGTHLEKTE